MTRRRLTRAQIGVVPLRAGPRGAPRLHERAHASGCPFREGRLGSSSSSSTTSAPRRSSCSTSPSGRSPAGAHRHRAPRSARARSCGSHSRDPSRRGGGTGSLNRVLSVFAAVALVAGCATTGPSAPGSTATIPPSHPGPTATVATPPAREARWAADLDAVIPGLERLTGSCTIRRRGPARRRHRRAQGPIPRSTDDQLMAGVLRVVALVSAAGREPPGAYVWGSGTTRPILRCGYGSFPRALPSSMPCRPPVARRADPGDDRCAPGGRGARGARSAHATRQPADRDPPGAAVPPRTTEILEGAESSPTRHRSR